MTTTDAMPPIARAATVLLLRPGTTIHPDSPGARPPEVFTITRSTKLAFSAGVSAFPGGRIDPSDELPGRLWEGTDLAAWGRLLGLEPDAAGQVLAGVVRETYEETGILLAQHRDGTPVDAALVEGLPADTRIRVERHELDFGALLTDLDLRPAVSGLRPASRWITPTGQSRRYDTFFFLTPLPRHQSPGTLSFEGAGSRWTTARAALEDFRSGRHQLLPPTWAQFRALEPVGSLQEALALPGTMEPISPAVTTTPPQALVGFPDHKAYAQDLAEGLASGQP